MRPIRRRPTALIDAEQDRLRSLSPPKPTFDTRTARGRRGDAAAAKARSRTLASREEMASTMRALRTPNHPLRVLSLACLVVALEQQGEVNPNRVRDYIRPGGVWVPALHERGRNVSHLYSDLCGAGLLRQVGKTDITGLSGGNGGKRCGLYQLTAKGLRVLSDLPEGAPLSGSVPDVLDALAIEIDPTDYGDDLFNDQVGDER